MSKYTKSVICQNGPKEGTWVDSPADVDIGRAVALPWTTPKGLLQYAVYTVTRLPNPDPTSREMCLMYMRSHTKPEDAQEHVDRIAFAVGMAREAAEMN